MTALDHAGVPDDASTYQRRRLWCGIAGIGSILVALWAAAAFGLGARFDASFAGLPPEAAGAVAALLLGTFAGLIQLGPDLVAIQTERRFGQRPGDAALFPAYVGNLAAWLGGLVVAGAIVGLCHRLAGDLWWLLAIPGLLGLAFVHVIYPLAPLPRVGPPEPAWQEAVAGELRSAGLTVPTMAWFDTGERALAGGWNGVGPLRRLFLAKSLEGVEPRVAAALIAREIGHARLGHRAATIALTAIWVTGGLAIAGLLSGGFGAAGTVFVAAAVMSTWCWLGLLGLWPTLGKRQVLAADRFVADAFDVATSRRMLDELDERNLPDPSLASGVEFVFHPIPPMDKRRAALKRLPKELP